MDIDNQDELVDYEDGDAPMGAEADTEVIIVEEGDADMIDEENLGTFLLLSHWLVC